MCLQGTALSGHEQDMRNSLHDCGKSLMPSSAAISPTSGSSSPSRSFASSAGRSAIASTSLETSSDGRGFRLIATS